MDAAQLARGRRHRLIVGPTAGRDVPAECGASGSNSAYHALLRGGRSGFDAVLGGERAADGQYDDLDAHGFYWTASEDAPATALFYNFGRGSTALYRQTDGDKPMALSVRCIQ